MERKIFKKTEEDVKDACKYAYEEMKKGFNPYVYISEFKAFVEVDELLHVPTVKEKAKMDEEFGTMVFASNYKEDLTDEEIKELDQVDFENYGYKGFVDACLFHLIRKHFTYTKEGLIACCKYAFENKITVYISPADMPELYASKEDLFDIYMKYTDIIYSYCFKNVEELIDLALERFNSQIENGRIARRSGM